MFAREAVFLFGAAAAGEKYTLYTVIIPSVRSVFGSWRCLKDYSKRNGTGGVLVLSGAVVQGER